MAKYRKIDPRVWNDANFREFSDRGKLAFLFGLTHPHLTALGAMRASIPGMAAELEWSEKAFREAFGEALGKGMVKADEKASFVWYPNYLKYNPPESLNVVVSWPKWLPYLPECSLKSEMLQQVKAFVEALGEGYAIAFAKAMPILDLDLELEHELEHEEEKRPAAPPLDIPFEQIVQDLNQKTGREGKYKLDWKTRETQRQIRARFKEGHTLEDFLHVNTVKSAEWLDSSKMSPCLVPDILYCRKHFATYAKQMPAKPELRGMTYAEEQRHFAGKGADRRMRDQSDFTPGDPDAAANAALQRALVDRNALRQCYADKCRVEGVEWTKEGEAAYLAEHENAECGS